VLMRTVQYLLVKITIITEVLAITVGHHWWTVMMHASMRLLNLWAVACMHACMYVFHVFKCLSSSFHAYLPVSLGYICMYRYVCHPLYHINMPFMP
jgi:hypothetical protein